MHALIEAEACKRPTTMKRLVRSRATRSEIAQVFAMLDNHQTNVYDVLQIPHDA